MSLCVCVQRNDVCVCVCVCQGFMDLNMTEFQKLSPNVTGFQLVNRSDPAVMKINQDWLDFDSKDLKLARRRLKVLAVFTSCSKSTTL